MHVFWIDFDEVGENGNGLVQLAKFTPCHAEVKEEIGAIRSARAGDLQELRPFPKLASFEFCNSGGDRIEPVGYPPHRNLFGRNGHYPVGPQFSKLPPKELGYGVRKLRRRNVPSTFGKQRQIEGSEGNGGFLHRTANCGIVFC